MEPETMAISPLDSTVFAGVFGDPEIGPLFSDAAEIRGMIDFERALARAEAACGVIPTEAGVALDVAMDGLDIPPGELTDATTAAAVPVPGLVAALRKRIDPEAAQWLHWGATTQDIMDGGLLLRLRESTAIMEARLDRLIEVLLAAAEREATTAMAGRTRSQVATPISFGLRIAQWAQPLIDLREMLDEVRPRLFRVQFGGASGANTAVAPHGPAIIAALATELDMQAAAPWHTSRVGLLAAMDWHAQLVGALGKMAGDLMMMGRSEIREARAGKGGGSSTMPQKSNPVTAEALGTLARYAAGLLAPAHFTAGHLEERDGVAWPLEWLVLPQIVVATGAGLRHALDLAESIEADAVQMRRGLDLGGGAAMAEAASFALAAHMPRADAQALMKRVAVEAARTGESLGDILRRESDVAIDWDEALDPVRAAEPSRDIIAMIVARWRGRGRSSTG
jgi:3-carboxy-cis,cis-muconate cycloisomerase